VKRKFTFVSLPTGRQANGVPVKSGQYPAACRGGTSVQGLPWGGSNTRYERAAQADPAAEEITVEP